MISILKLGSKIYILDNQRIGDTEVYRASIVATEEAEVTVMGAVTGRMSQEVPNDLEIKIGKKVVPPGPREFKNFSIPKREKNLTRALNAVQQDRIRERTLSICEAYALHVGLDGGMTCHSSAVKFAKREGFPISKGTVYILIAYALVHGHMEATDTYPMKWRV